MFASIWPLVLSAVLEGYIRALAFLIGESVEAHAPTGSFEGCRDLFA
jgi:hypothetical protein